MLAITGRQEPENKQLAHKFEHCSSKMTAELKASQTNSHCEPRQRLTLARAPIQDTARLKARENIAGAISVCMKGLHRYTGYTRYTRYIG